MFLKFKRPTSGDVNVPMIMTNRYPVFFFLVFFLIPFGMLTAASPQNVKRSSVYPQDLRYEYLFEPRGIDELQPRFSWTLAPTDSKAFGQKQTAYRILVASSVDALKNDRADVWDSSWIESDAMRHVVYQGRPLESDKSYFWKVAVKDEESRISSWSKIASWTTGLLNEA